MLTVFKELLRVNLSHNYYADNIIPGFIAAPTGDCRSSLNDKGILFRQDKDGFLLLAQAEGPNSNKPLRDLKNSGKFSFYLIFKNQFFKNFSNLPLDTTANNIYHFSNLNDNGQNSELLLTKDSNAKFVSGDDLTLLKPQRFSYKESNPNNIVTIDIKNIKGEIVKHFKEYTAEGELSADINLNDHRPGKYELLIGGSSEMQFYADDSLKSILPFAVVDIYIDDSVPSSYSAVDSNGDIAFKTYQINFDKRKAHWKYFIVLKNQKSIDPADLSIEYPGNAHSFNKESAVTLPGNIKAVPFVSQNEIEFNEQIVKGIQLKKTNGGNSGWYDIENLPNASARYLKPDIPNNKAYSEIFVYV